MAFNKIRCSSDVFFEEKTCQILLSGKPHKNSHLARVYICLNTVFITENRFNLHCTLNKANLDSDLTLTGNEILNSSLGEIEQIREHSMRVPARLLQVVIYSNSAR